jgi:hypothetical protein
MLTVLATPFITSGVMFVVKWLVGLAMTDNGDATKWWLRALLVVLSLLGYVADSALNGTPVDPNIVSSDVVMFVSTGALAYLAHAFYSTLFRQSVSPSLDTPPESRD